MTTVPSGISDVAVARMSKFAVLSNCHELSGNLTDQSNFLGLSVLASVIKWYISKVTDERVRNIL